MVRRAHPRSRGEHAYGSGEFVYVWGSSPLARGTRSVYSVVVRVTGLIPARAGNTASSSYPPANHGAHPRSRGEHRVAYSHETLSKGSSPLARGTPVLATVDRTDAGLIPARAGNTMYKTSAPIIAGAHPRSRGEHGERLCCRARPAGSSPLARGTPAC